MRQTGPVRWVIASLATLVVSTAGFGAFAAMSGDGDTKGTAFRDGHAAHAEGAHAHGVAPAVVPGEVNGLDPWRPVAIEHTLWNGLGEGKIPSKEEARTFADKWSRFVAKGDAGIDRLRAQGYLSGEGTEDDPYVLERFYVDGDLTIQSTDRAIVIRNGYVGGQLSLNYIGEAVHVHHVYAKDLRVNENVARSGDNTGGVFHDNAFGFVGQIRHFTGTFFDNTVGPRPQGVTATALGDSGIIRVPEEVVFNFDGFHGADVHHNTFHGMVDIKLHGHNHGDCFLCPVHDHADPTGYPAGQEGREEPNGTGDGAHDHPLPEEYETLGMRSHHSVRYHSLLFRDNTIHVPEGVALRYNDRNHAGDDRTANSEPNDHLEDPHLHHQDITFARNTLDGGRFQLEIFNARDDRHVVANTGALRILDHDITVRYDPTQNMMVTGIQFGDAEDIELLVRGNTVRFEKKESEDPRTLFMGTFKEPPVLTGIHLHVIRTGNLTIAENTVATGDYGIYANGMTERVYWELLGNDFRTATDYRGAHVEATPHEGDDLDDTRRERPEGEAGTAAKDEDAHTHDHGGH